MGGLDQVAANDMLTRTRFSKDFIRRVVPNNQFIPPGDIQRSTEEDTSMLAFFDLLVDREKARWSSFESTTDSDSDSDEDEDMNGLPFMFETSSSSDSHESSFNIENSFSDSSQELDDTVAGPSWWNPGGSSQISEETTATPGTIPKSRLNLMSLVETSSEEEDVSRSPSPTGSRETEPVVFRQVHRNRKQYRRRLPSSSSSS